ncbi:MAG: hypothetical protein ACI8QS_000185 [Planctomycetota bacterium]|jgi:hypothetical protein
MEAQSTIQVRGAPHGVLRRFAVLGLAIVVACGLGEMLVRVFVPEPEVLQPFGLRAFHNDKWVELPPEGQSLFTQRSNDPYLQGLRGELIPGTRFRLCYDAQGPWRRPYFDADGCVEAVINSAGFRGPEFEYTKPEGTYRIAVLGDSFTFGHGVPFEATWGEFLEAKLQVHLDSNEQANSPKRAEVLNFGVNGYDILDVELVLQHKALAWSVDRVIYGFFPNDLFVAKETDAAPGDQTDFDFQNVQEVELHDQLFGSPSGLSRYSRLFFLLERALAARRIDALTTSTYLRAGTPGSRHFEAWKAGLVSMARVCEARNVPLDVVIFPEMASLDDGHAYAPIYVAVEEAARELGLGAVQVFDAWEGHEASSLWVHPTDHHPNEIAHSLAGEAVSRALIEAGWPR